MRIRRSGFTLIEMVVVMTLMAVILSVSVGAIGLFMRMEGDGAKHLSQASTWFRLSHEFRTDVHAALDAPRTEEENAENVSLELSLPDDLHVVYRATDGAVERVASRDGKTLRTERFRLPPGTVDVEHDDALGLVRLVFHQRETLPGSTAPAAPDESWTISAAVGMDHLPLSPAQEE